jgi:hypothetical protein
VGLFASGRFSLNKERINSRLHQQSNVDQQDQILLQHQNSEHALAPITTEGPAQNQGLIRVDFFIHHRANIDEILKTI